MIIRDKTETSFMLVKRGVQLKELKPTPNRRLLWMDEGNAGGYTAKCRVAFIEPPEIGGRIQTEHVCVIKSGDSQVDIIIEVETQNFVPSVQGRRCKIIEKERGINCKCTIDEAET